MLVMIDEFCKVKASEHYESINSVGQNNLETIYQPSTSGVKQSPVKAASFTGVLVNNRQVYKYFTT
jgi:hypothetical protein